MSDAPKMKSELEGMQYLYNAPAAAWMPAPVPPTGAQLMADPRVKALVEAAENCLTLLDGLVAESGRGIDWGEEDAFRRGEWFEADDLANIAAARNALAAFQQGGE